MASVNEGLARAYATLIENGKRVLADVNPEALRARVEEILKEDGYENDNQN